MEDKQQDACLAALLGHLHVQLDTKGIVSLFVSLTQYKQITHGPMEPAKHRAQCIQKYVSYKERIRQIIYTAFPAPPHPHPTSKQLSANARRHAADLMGKDGTELQRLEHSFASLRPTAAGIHQQEQLHS